MRALHLRSAVASLLAALCAAPVAALVPPAVELVRPRAGERLTAGSEAIVEWRLLGAELDPTIEEWEAFLSLDGGGYYAYRLTPHLDASLRRFTFRVPALASDDARILLRFGDEVREVGVAIPHRFTIRLPAFAVLGRGRRIPARGEPARPGEPGVVSWVEGSRTGGGLEHFESHTPSSTGAAMLPGLGEPTPALTRETPAPVRAAAGERAPPPAPAPPLGDVRTTLSPTSILLLGCRRNE